MIQILINPTWWIIFIPLKSLEYQINGPWRNSHLGEIIKAVKKNFVLWMNRIYLKSVQRVFAVIKCVILISGYYSCGLIFHYHEVIYVKTTWLSGEMKWLFPDENCYLGWLCSLYSNTALKASFVHLAKAFCLCCSYRLPSCLWV